MSRKIFFLFGLILSSTVMAIEEPKYKVIEKEMSFELRAYESMVVAETYVSGSLDQASSKGFRRIAGYIFGSNTNSEGKKEKVSMTAPVVITASSPDVNMISQTKLESNEGKWRVHFVMPSKYQIDALPTPNKENVLLREVPAQKFAVIRFSGLASEEKISQKTKELQKFLNEREIKPLGEPILARYNPPWTLPFMRRNEIMVSY